MKEKKLSSSQTSQCVLHTMHAIAVNQLASTPDMDFHRKEFMIMASYVEKWQYNAGWNKETLCCLIQCSTLYKATGNRLCVFIIWSLRTTHACQGMARLVSRVGDLDVVRQQEGEGVQPGCAHACTVADAPIHLALAPHHCSFKTALYLMNEGERKVLSLTWCGIKNFMYPTVEVDRAHLWKRFISQSAMLTSHHEVLSY